MQELFKVIAGGFIIWMAWGSWTVFRPNSGFFDKRYYSGRDELDNRIYAAFLGALMALGILIYAPTLWISNLILPTHWGSYNDDGDWSSYSERIAGLAATFGALGALYRMSKTGRTILQAEFWTNRFRPKEVSLCTEAFVALKPLFERVMCADTVLSHVEEAIPSDRGREICRAAIQAGSAPRNVVLRMILQTAKSMLASGQFHVYRNVLGMEGNGIKSMFEIALNELLKCAGIDEAGATAERLELQAAIKEVG